MPSTAHPQDHPDAGTELVRMWEAGDPIATIVLIHGIAEHSGWYEKVGELFAEAGFTVRSFDLIGFGGTGGRRGHIDDFSQYLDQVESHVVWARQQERPLVLLGNSMGGTIAAGYLLEDRTQPDLAVLRSPAFESGAPWQQALAPILSWVLPRVRFPQALRRDQLSRDPAVGDAYFSDPLIYRKVTGPLGNGMFQMGKRAAAHLHEVSIPILILHGLDDTIVSPTCTAAAGKLPGVERRTYPGLRHDLFNEPEWPEIVGEVITWLRERL